MEWVQRTKALQPSARGELEITDLNVSYLNDGLLDVKVLGRGVAWLDTGTPESLLEAGHYIKKIFALATLGVRKGKKG